MSSTAIPERRAAVHRAAGEANDLAAREARSDGSVLIPPAAGGGEPARPPARRINTQKKDEWTVQALLMHLVPFLLVGLAYFALKALAASAKPKFDWHRTEYVYAFGDSYTFVQGTKGHANFSFIGDAFNLGFTPEDIHSNEIVPHNTSSDGSNWIEFLTACFEGQPSKCSPHQLWDFAFAGADIDPTLLPLHHNFTVDLVDQVKQWLMYAADVVPHPRDKTLSAWWTGINDTGDTLNNATITDWNAFWQQEMQSYFRAVELAYTRSLSGTYLFINVPPEQRAPARVNDPAGQAKMEQHILAYNAILADYINHFATTHRDVNVLTFDAYSWFNDILDHADQYGFTNITGYCQCTDPSFFWYNTGHPTEHVHKLLAQAIEAQLLAASG